MSESWSSWPGGDWRESRRSQAHALEGLEGQSLGLRRVGLLLDESPRQLLDPSLVPPPLPLQRCDAPLECAPVLVQLLKLSCTAVV